VTMSMVTMSITWILAARIMSPTKTESLLFTV
jgi:hypothetical protein